eukprot:scaffold8044_cov277-Pinguiococcus_pyrenoidosus.AAC.4
MGKWTGESQASRAVICRSARRSFTSLSFRTLSQHEALLVSRASQQALDDPHHQDRASKTRWRHSRSIPASTERSSGASPPSANDSASVWRVCARVWRRRCTFLLMADTLLLARRGSRLASAAALLSSGSTSSAAVVSFFMKAGCAQVRSDF